MPPNGLAKFHAVSVGLRWVVVNHGMLTGIMAAYRVITGRPFGFIPRLSRGALRRES